MKKIFIPSYHAIYHPFSLGKKIDIGAFTLIELVVSVTILSTILLSVFVIYSNLIQVNKKLEAMRIIQENVRNVTEQIAGDVRERGINFDYYDGSPGQEFNNYTGSGNLILAIQGGIQYFPMKAGPGGPVICNESDQKDPLIHCYIGEKRGPIYKTLSDERVEIENIRFFISGESGTSMTNLSKEGKVTIVLSLVANNKTGVNNEIAKNTHMSIETTISEKIYKQN